MMKTSDRDGVSNGSRRTPDRERVGIAEAESSQLQRCFWDKNEILGISEAEVEKVLRC